MENPPSTAASSSRNTRTTAGGTSVSSHPMLRAASSYTFQPDAAVLDRLERWLGGEAPGDCQDDEERGLRLRAITRFQQLTSPVAAKAVEDTAGYRSAVLISRNDVGFDPQSFCIPLPEFHTASAFRQRHFPHSLVTTATHDHKRGEDVRARLAALSEKGGLFAERVRQWRAQAGSLRRSVASGEAPSPGDELILYQLLLGAWSPSLDSDDEDAMREFTERLAQWQQKALREAKLRSHWLWPDEAYEQASRAFLEEALLGDPACREALAAAFRVDFEFYSRAKARPREPLVHRYAQQLVAMARVSSR